MVLEAKKEQMDTLLKELQSLREAQLKKGVFFDVHYGFGLLSLIHYVRYSVELSILLS